jgi:hypothetical protein
LFANPPLRGYGENATAGEFVTGPPQATGTVVSLPTYLQDVCQFASTAAAASYFRADFASYRRCWSGSTTLVHLRWAWTTQSLTKGYFGGHRAFYDRLISTVTGAPASRTYAQIVLAGTDVFTVATTGTPARPAPAAALASLITRVRG